MLYICVRTKERPVGMYSLTEQLLDILTLKLSDGFKVPRFVFSISRPEQDSNAGSAEACNVVKYRQKDIKHSAAFFL